MQVFKPLDDKHPSYPAGVVLMAIDRQKIREMQLAVLRRCGERIERAGYAPSECFQMANQEILKRGFTGAMRSRHGL